MLKSKRVRFWKKKFIWDLVMAILVVFMPFLIYAHTLFDDNADTFIIFGYEYYHGFNGNSLLVWFFLSKLIPILLLILWFLNTFYWWRYFIFIPLVLWIDALVRVFLRLPNSNEDFRFLYSFLVIVLIFTLLVLTQNYLKKYDISNRILVSYNNWPKPEYKKLFRQINNKTSSVLSCDKAITKEEKLRSFYFIKLTIKGKLERYLIAKKRGIQVRRFDIVIVFVLVLIPFIYYSAWLFPDDTKQYELFWFTINSYGFPDVSVFIWVICGKICILIANVIWFITSQNWWRFAILSPIILTIYQTIETLNSAQVDETSFVKTLPWVVVVVVLLLFFSKAANYKSKILDIYNVLSEEVEQLMQKMDGSTRAQEKEQILEHLKNNKEKNRQQKIASLIKIREELLIDLKTKT